MQNAKIFLLSVLVLGACVIVFTFLGFYPQTEQREDSLVLHKAVQAASQGTQELNLEMNSPEFEKRPLPSAVKGIFLKRLKSIQSQLVQEMKRTPSADSESIFQAYRMLSQAQILEAEFYLKSVEEASEQIGQGAADLSVTLDSLALLDPGQGKQQARQGLLERLNKQVAGLVALCVSLDQNQRRSADKYGDAVASLTQARKNAPKGREAESIAGLGQVYCSSSRLFTISSITRREVGEFVGEAVKQLGSQVSVIKDLEAHYQVAVADGDRAAQDLAKAAEAFGRASRLVRSDEKTLYQRLEYQARMQRFALTGDKQDKTAAEELFRIIEGKKK